MNRTEYYSFVKKIALEQRRLFKFETTKVTLRDMRKVYKYHGIKIMLWPPPNSDMVKPKSIRGVYSLYDGHPCVLINRNLPTPQRIFTLAHRVANHVERLKAIGNGQVPAVVRLAWETLR